MIEVDNPKNILIEDFFVQNSEEDLELITKSNHMQAQSLTQSKPITVTEKSQKVEEKTEIRQNEQEKASNEQSTQKETETEDMKPKSPDLKMKLSKKLPKKSSLDIPPVLPASISDDLTGFGSYSNMGVFDQGNDYL